MVKFQDFWDLDERECRKDEDVCRECLKIKKCVSCELVQRIIVRHLTLCVPMYSINFVCTMNKKTEVQHVHDPRVWECQTIDGKVQGIVLDCEKFTTLGLQKGNEFQNVGSVHLLRHVTDDEIVFMMSVVKQCEQQQLQLNINALKKKWYEDGINKCIPFTGGLANVWSDRCFNIFTVYFGQKAICSVELEFYELVSVSRLIIHFRRQKGIMVCSDLLQMVCDFVDYQVHYTRLFKHIRTQLHLLGKQKLEKIQVSLIEPLSREYRSICYYCEKKLPRKKKKCSGCEIAFYCNHYCQKKDWLLHREYCKSKRLVVDDVTNMRYMHDWL